MLVIADSLNAMISIREPDAADAELGTEAISRQRKEAGGLPITVGCTQSKRVAFCLHISWAEPCGADIILYRSL